ncbi:hypothetical protein JOE69_001125 [Arthrobacter russicus]|uniref:Uncharacterized protein n=1 Tax=Arthrobacter russicus TaxID=172040 RepID=A0ABU1J8Y8_9MICC|nr:hypothetical protein [Arthrobacter russicus]
MNRIRIYQCNCTHCTKGHFSERQWIVQYPQPGRNQASTSTFSYAQNIANTYLRATAK